MFFQKMNNEDNNTSIMLKSTVATTVAMTNLKQYGILSKKSNFEKHWQMER